MADYRNLKLILGLCAVFAAAIAIAVASANASTESEPSTTEAAATRIADVPTSAVAVVQPDIANNFALFRAQGATPMPADLAKALGSPTKFGRNAALARKITTPSGTGWVIPGDGFICLAVPDPVDGYGESCTATDVVVKQGLWVGLRGDGPDAKSLDTVLVPDGKVAVVDSGSGQSTLAASPLGVASGRDIAGDGKLTLISSK